MLTSQRKQLILEKLAAEGQVQSKALSAHFAVSEDTIRRDLRELAAEGRLQRVHGGALPASSATVPFAERKTVKMDAKKMWPVKAQSSFPWAGGDCRRRHHHIGTDRVFTGGFTHYRGHTQPEHCPWARRASFD